MTTALIDCDSIVYRCGFAGETTSLQVVYEDADGGIHTKGFMADPKQGSARKQMLAFMELEGRSLLDEQSRIEPDPIENVLHSAKRMIEDILGETKCNEFLIYLTGKSNYRDAIATIRPYKGNRDKLSRPVHYEALRQYLVKYWEAQVIEGQEADDEISIVARTPEYRDNCVICSIDKDLDQIPGRHYDFVKKVAYDVREDEAELCFYRQCLSGDAVDNIPGCYKTGYSKAERLLEATPRNEWWEAVIETYRNSQSIPGCPYAELDAAAVALETAQLVRLRTYEGEVWTP